MLRYNSPDCPVHQRSNGYFAQRSPAKAEDLDEQCATVRVRAEPPVKGASDTEQCLFGAASDCPVPLEDKAPNGQKFQNSNGWVTWLAHRTVRCAHQQQSSPTVVWWLRAIESHLEGGEYGNLKFINFKHHYKPGLALEIKASMKERAKTIHKQMKADDTVICFTEVWFL
jgi:hypothetical protein